jgi:hypothetical protein
VRWCVVEVLVVYAVLCFLDIEIHIGTRQRER